MKSDGEVSLAEFAARRRRIIQIIFPAACTSEKFFSAASVSEGRAQSAAILLAMKSSDFMPAYIAKNLPCTATTASRQNSRLTVANTATTFFSLQPHISK